MSSVKRAETQLPGKWSHPPAPRVGRAPSQSGTWVLWSGNTRGVCYIESMSSHLIFHLRSLVVSSFFFRNVIYVHGGSCFFYSSEVCHCVERTRIHKRTTFKTSAYLLEMSMICWSRVSSSVNKVWCAKFTINVVSCGYPGFACALMSLCFCGPNALGGLWLFGSALH